MKHNKGLFIVRRVEGQVGCVNWADIKTLLIKEAAKCESYSSDIIYEINRIQTKLDEMTLSESDDRDVLELGFRSSGVDAIARRSTIEELFITIDDEGYHNGICYLAYSRVLAVALTRRGGWMTVELYEMI